MTALTMITMMRHCSRNSGGSRSTGREYQLPTPSRSLQHPNTILQKDGNALLEPLVAQEGSLLKPLEARSGPCTVRVADTLNPKTLNRKP